MKKTTAVVWICAATLGATACAPHSRTTRVQAPYFAVDRPAEIALVSVTVPRWVLERAPSDFSNMRGIVSSGLATALDGTSYKLVDKVDLGYTMVIGPKADAGMKIGFLTLQQEPTLPQDQIYVAEKPIGIPVGVTQDLVLGVHVADWRIAKVSGGTEQKPTNVEQASVDLVYSLWTRKTGQEIETRRVRVNLSAGGKAREAVTFLPQRSHWMDFSGAKQWFGKMPVGNSREEIFRSAVATNVGAFTFPYGPREMHFTAQWDDSNDLMKPGIALAKENRFDDAFADWQKLAEADPKLAAAIFNMGVVRELKGDDAEALKLYEKATTLNPESGLYRRTHQALKERVALRKLIPLS